jgi:hypothetical protein
LFCDYRVVSAGIKHARKKPCEPAMTRTNWEPQKEELHPEENEYRVQLLTKDFEANEFEDSRFMTRIPDAELDMKYKGQEKELPFD